jgi:hypothetical protein
MRNTFALFGREAKHWPLAVLCLLFVISAKPAHASNYSCGNPSTGHCYGYTHWQEQPQYFGSYTSILQIAMNCPSNCGGFINNEMWLGDDHSQACLSNGFGACWVEAGYHAFPGEGNPYYFWADSRPMTSNTYNNHFLNQADVADFTHFMIILDARGGPGVYQVWIYNDNLSVLFNGASTSNTMTANEIDIGTELAGTTGASAAPSQFQQNFWAVSPLTSQYIFWYNTEVDNGAVTSQAPPNASWLIPASLSGSNGGIFSTNCCQ